MAKDKFHTVSDDDWSSGTANVLSLEEERNRETQGGGGECTVNSVHLIIVVA